MSYDDRQDGIAADMWQLSYVNCHLSNVRAARHLDSRLLPSRISVAPVNKAHSRVVFSLFRLLEWFVIKFGVVFVTASEQIEALSFFSIKCLSVHDAPRASTILGSAVSEKKRAWQKLLAPVC